MANETLPGPIDFILIEFPAGASTGSAAEAMSHLVDSGIVRIYDIALIRKSTDGSSDRVELGKTVEDAGAGFEPFAGAQSGLFDAEDIAQAGAALKPDTVALLVAYENAWAAPFVTAAHAAGGQVIASERIPAQTLIDVLDAAEAAD